MIREKIVETFKKGKNKDLPEWYEGKVLELADYFLKHAKIESILDKTVWQDNFLESHKQEVSIK